MKKLILIGGNKGIGQAIFNEIQDQYDVIMLNRGAENFDILADDLPEVEEIDALVYCPGSINLKPFGSLKVEDFQKDFEINYFGFLKCLKFYEKSFKQGASVLAFSTVASLTGMPYHSSIASAKGALNGLVKSLAAEWAGKIRVNAIAPSITQTDLAAPILRNERVIERITNNHPLKRILTASEIAKYSKFLISEDAAGISGQILVVDNGIINLKL
ncbi:SDR family oxidoreductase [Flavobacteriaceae bacterium]|nr:SDR family oxidoreductase [Flavobacteriaceae bacterium]